MCIEFSCCFFLENKTVLYKYLITKDVEYAKYCSKNRLLINTEANLSKNNSNDTNGSSDGGDSICVQFVNELYLNQFIAKLKELKSGKNGSLFDHRTDQSSATQYFQVNNMKSISANMLLQSFYYFS